MFLFPREPKLWKFWTFELSRDEFYVDRLYTDFSKDQSSQFTINHDLVSAVGLKC